MSQGISLQPSRQLRRRYRAERRFKAYCVGALLLSIAFLVLFFSDNGANRNGSNGLLRGNKGSVWEGGHRVPAIAWWPGTVAAGRTTAVTAISLDVMPTLVELAGGRLPEGHRLDGRSLVEVLTAKEAGGRQSKRLGRRDLFWEFGKRAAVRRDDWKLVVGQMPAGRVGLYNLKSDLGEQKNLAAGQPGRVKQMQALLAAWRTEVARGATVQPERAQQKNRVPGK